MPEKHPAPAPALIFDFGNVVAFFDYARACQAFGEKLGLSAADFLALLRARGLTPLVERFERGAITSLEFSRAFAALAGLDIPHHEFQAAWADIFWLNQPVAALVRSLRRLGYTLVLGSNTNELHANHFLRQFADTFVHFDRLILSYQIGHIKPSAEFYAACVAAANATPDACVFIDDMPENVEGARAAGLAAILYRDMPNLLADLRRLGVEIESQES
jgi:glucose-1-phosphatase